MAAVNTPETLAVAWPRYVHSTSVAPDATDAAHYFYRLPAYFAARQTW